MNSISQASPDAVMLLTEAMFLLLSCAGHEVVIEEFLDGEEASFFALIDGRTCIPLASAQVPPLFPPSLPFHLCSAQSGL